YSMPNPVSTCKDVRLERAGKKQNSIAPENSIASAQGETKSNEKETMLFHERFRTGKEICGGMPSTYLQTLPLIHQRQKIGQNGWLASPRDDDVVLCLQLEIIDKNLYVHSFNESGQARP
ncbi:hypothetical protein AVEN_116371-1, partial [Araneus ventricosus]